MNRSFHGCLPFLLLLGLSISCSDVSPPKDDTALVDPYTTDDRFIPGILVQAKAIDVSLHDNSSNQITTFDIEHVYVGPAQLKGTKFRTRIATHEPMGSMLVQHWYYPVPTLGEVGIWALMPLEDQFGASVEFDRRVYPNAKALTPVKKLRPGSLDQKQPYPFPPFRQGVNPNYYEWVKWAELVETAYRAKGADRRAILERTSKSEKQAWANWAADLLERIDRADTQPNSHPPPFTKRQVRPTKPATPPRHPSAPQTTMGEVTRPR